MSEETIKIPKFRKTSRIASWMEKNEYEGRMPEEVENLFFTSKESAEEIMISLVDYYYQLDKNLPEKLENLLYEKAKEAIPNAENENLSFMVEFLRFLKNRLWYGDGVEVCQKYIDLYIGKSSALVDLAITTVKRLPSHLEDSISDPHSLLDYAREVLRGRLPSHLEDVFLKDVHVATQYAFEVIRGFAPVKLPDALHNFVIMESFKNPDDSRIKTYMKASESDPNKTGNWASWVISDLK